LCCDVGLVSELRLTAGCVLMDLASPAVSGTSVYASGLKDKGIGWEGTEPTACCEHGIELACCIKDREFDVKLSSINFTGKTMLNGVNC